MNKIFTFVPVLVLTTVICRPVAAENSKTPYRSSSIATGTAPASNDLILATVDIHVDYE